jgi:hypothetical protein
MTANITFEEGAAGNPIDATNIIAIIGYLSGQSPSSDPLHPNVIAIDSPPRASDAAPQGGSIGYGAPLELAHIVSRRGKKRVLLVPCSGTISGSASAVTQVGQGAVCTVTPDGGGPFDDAALAWQIKKSGACGVAEVAFSWSSQCINGVASAAYQGAITVPDRAPAQVLGNIDLTTIAYAKAATVTGTVDLTTLTYGPGGDLDNLTISLNRDGAGAHTVTFDAPDSPDEVVSQIAAAHSSLAAVPSLSQQNKLVLTGVTLGATGSIVTGAGGGGTAYTVLGITAAHTTNGTAGALDAETLLFDDDTSSGQTVTFSAPSGPAAVASQIIAQGTGITADVYGATSLLRVRSTTKGSTSTLVITGGTGRAALGLPLVSAAGAESTYYIPHLGITVNFTPGANGNFVLGTSYGTTCKAPRPDDTEILARIADLDASGYAWGVLAVVGEVDLPTSLARATTLDTAMVAEHGRNYMRRARFGTLPGESDANTRSTFTSFRSAWVSRSDRGAYLLTSSNIPGSGYVLRSPMWMACMADAFLPLYKDIGDHGVRYDVGIIGLPDVGAITVDESTAPTKLVGQVGASGTSSNVLTRDTDGGFYFVGGYTLADGTSRYTDQSVTNVMLRMGEIVAAQLAKLQNDTEIDTEDDETITPESADIIDGAIVAAVSSELVPAALQGVSSQVDTSLKFYSQKKLKATVTGKNRVPARSVEGVISPGSTIQTTNG